MGCVVEKKSWIPQHEPFIKTEGSIQVLHIKGTVFVVFHESGKIEVIDRENYCLFMEVSGITFHIEQKDVLSLAGLIQEAQPVDIIVCQTKNRIVSSVTPLCRIQVYYRG